MNTRTFYILTQERNKIEEELAAYETMIDEIRKSAKIFKRGSEERKNKMNEANKIKNSDKYKELKVKLGMINYCINVVCYY